MKKSVLITGGSEGIGYAFACYFAGEGDRVYLCARNEAKLTRAEERLKEEYHSDVDIICGDLSDRECVKSLHHAFKGNTPDIVVNNAGIGYTGRALERTADEDEKLIDLNVTAVVDLSRMFARDMVKRGSGLIINLSSTGAGQPGPYIAAYYASKSFVLSYGRALDEELKGTGVHVCTVCPGPVDTGFYDKYGGRKPAGAMKPEQVVAYTMSHVNKQVVVPGFSNRIAGLVPDTLRMKAVKKMKEAVLKPKQS